MSRIGKLVWTSSGLSVATALMEGSLGCMNSLPVSLRCHSTLSNFYYVLGAMMLFASGGILYLIFQGTAQLVLSECPEQVSIFGDSDRLLQVMNNLMSNAAKFSRLARLWN